MLIRQKSMFSFDEIVEMQIRSQEEIQLHQVLSEIDATKISRVFSKERRKGGSKGYYAECMIYALVAMRPEKIPTNAVLAKILPLV